MEQGKNFGIGDHLTGYKKPQEELQKEQEEQEELRIKLATPKIIEFSNGACIRFTPERPISRKETINGIEMELRWADGIREYIIGFPQYKKEQEEEFGKENVEDSCAEISISSSPEAVELAWEFASLLAKNGKSLQEIVYRTDELCSQFKEYRDTNVEPEERKRLLEQQREEDRKAGKEMSPEMYI